jgi:hypothetical protein
MTILSVLGTIISVPLISAILNILRQIFFKDPRTPPEVFHYLPVIGSTIQYGMDPYAFFFKCRAKVHHIPSAVEIFFGTDNSVWRLLHLHSFRQENNGLPWC